MHLSDDERQRLKEEEFFRAEVRKSLEVPKAPPDRWARVTAFLESKVGF